MYRNLEAEIIRAGIKREDVAQKIGKTYNSFSLKLRGKYPFTLDEAFTIATSFFPDIDIKYLFSKDTA